MIFSVEAEAAVYAKWAKPHKMRRELEAAILENIMPDVLAALKQMTIMGFVILPKLE